MAITFSIGLFPSVTIYAKENLHGIGINKLLMVMKEGDKYQLEPYGYNNATSGGFKTKFRSDISNVTWKSSNTKIATIDKKGMLVAKKSGVCTITATHGKFKAICKVRVYTEKQLYQHVLDADIAHNVIYMALMENPYKNYDFKYDTKSIEVESDKKEADRIVKAAKKVEEIIKTVVTDDMSDYEIMMALAAWLVENIDTLNNYQSSYTNKWYYSSNKDYYYMDALLYGKSTDRGLGLTFELLLNVCGIRSEYMMTPGSFIFEDGEKQLVYDCNVIELDNEFYYFDIVGIANSLRYDKEYNDKENTFYDYIIPDHIDEFVNVTKYADRDLEYEIHSTPRYTYYDDLNQNFKNRMGLGLNLMNLSGYDYYFYEFYTNKIRFVTLKESQADPDNNISPKPILTTLPVYPDSSSSKYKIIMNELAVMNEKVIEATELVDEVYQKMKDGEAISTEMISFISDTIINVERDFDTAKASIIDRNAVKFMANKIGDSTKKLAEIQSMVGIGAGQ